MTRRGLLAGVVPAIGVSATIEKPKRMYATLDYQDLAWLYLMSHNLIGLNDLGSAILSGDFDERGIEWR